MKTLQTQGANYVMPDSTTRPSQNRSCGTTREIRLEHMRAASWEVCLEKLLASGNNIGELEEFYQELSDAYWLARWLRDYVKLDVELSVLPELLNELLASQLADEEVYAQHVLEDIVTTLTRTAA